MRTALLERTLRPGETLLWSGRPRAGLAPGDGEAATIASVAAFAALGLATTFGLETHAGIAPLGLPLAGLGAAVLGLVVTLLRVSAAGKRLTVGLVGAAPLFAMAAARGGWEKALALACPAGSVLFLLVWVALSWVESRATRYHLSRLRGFVEEPGRYVISFELETPPRAHPSRLAGGRVGSIEVHAARGQIRTQKGLVMAVPRSRRSFVRVPFPVEAVRAWEAGSSKADRPGPGQAPAPSA